LRPLALSLALALGVMAPLGLQAQNSAGRLPNIGDGNGMSVQQERRLGESIMRQLVTDADYMDDPVLMDYLQTIWQPLRESAMQLGNLQTEQEEAFAWDVFLIRDKSVNAFALPGGFMGVHLGLIAVVSSRDELASVMAHELSHVTQRHIARMQDQQGRSTPFLIAGMILGVLAASRSPDAATAMIMGGTAGSAQGQLNFSRDMEREADRLGFNVHAQAGFDSQGFVGMFQKLQQAARLSDNGNYPYLRSHPLTTERIGDMQARLGLGRTFAPVATSIEHAMMAARARSLMSPYVDDQQKIADTLEKDFAPELPVAKRAAMLYAGVMAYTQQRRAAPARSLEYFAATGARRSCRLACGAIIGGGHRAALEQPRAMPASLGAQGDRPCACPVANPMPFGRQANDTGHPSQRHHATVVGAAPERRLGLGLVGASAGANR